MAIRNPLSINDATLIPDLLRYRPQSRQVLDRYGLRGCGGPLGPHESLGFFARAHDVPLQRLIQELQADDGPISPSEAKVDPADTIYRRFFIAGIAVVLTLGATWGAWLLLQIAWYGSFRAAGVHEINAHGHAQIFGWVGLFVMGFAYQAFPRFKHTTLCWPNFAMASWWMMLTGIMVRSIFEPLAATNPMWIGLVMAAAIVEVLAVGICVAVLIKTWRDAPKLFVYYDAYIACALGWFFIQALAEAIYLAATLLIDANAKTDLVATWQAPVRDLQIHGFAMLMILGVSQRMLHHVYAFPEPNARLSLWALPLLNLAIIGEALGLVLMRKIGPGFATLWYAAVIILTGTVGKLVYDWKIFCRTEDTDRSLKFIRAAYVWLLVSLSMMLLMPAYQRGLLPWLAPESNAALVGFSHAFYGAVRHAITVGFISLMIVGVASRIVPTLNGIDGQTLPRLWVPFVLLNLGCSLRVFGQIVTDFTGSAFPVAGVSGVLEVTGLAIWGIHLIRIMLGWYRPIAVESRPADAVPVVPGEPIVGAHLVGEVLDTYPSLLNTFVVYGFRPLASPILRRILARGITIERACRLLKVNAPEFVEVLNAKLSRLLVALPVVEVATPATKPEVIPSCSCCAERAASTVKVNTAALMTPQTEAKPSC